MARLQKLTRSSTMKPDCSRPEPAEAIRIRRPSINITPIERLGRVTLGSAAVITGIVLLVAGNSVLAIVLEALLIVAGLDLVVTGALGHCPLYHKLGYVPSSLRRPE